MKTAERMEHDVHLVIPCYRESGRLRPFLEGLCTELEQLHGVHLLVVEDGGGAEEQERLRLLVEEFRGRHAFVREMLALPENLGKGGTVYAGWEHAGAAAWLMFADADGSVPAAEVARLIRTARADGRPDRAWFASRVKMLGRTVQRVWLRDVMAHVFHWMVNLLLGIAAHDTQCGCKLVPRVFFEKVRPALTLPGFAFDLELLTGLRAHGCEIVEVPVDWHEVPGGKIRLLRDPWLMLRDALRVRRLQRAGHYLHPETS